MFPSLCILTNGDKFQCRSPLKEENLAQLSGLKNTLHLRPSHEPYNPQTMVLALQDDVKGVPRTRHFSRSLSSYGLGHIDGTVKVATTQIGILIPFDGK